MLFTSCNVSFILVVLLEFVKLFKKKRVHEYLFMRESILHILDVSFFTNGRRWNWDHRRKAVSILADRNLEDATYSHFPASTFMLKSFKHGWMLPTRGWIEMLPCTNYSCAINILRWLMVGSFYSPCITKRIFSVFFGKPGTVQSMRARLVRRSLYNTCDRASLFWQRLSTRR